MDSQLSITNMVSKQKMKPLKFRLMRKTHFDRNREILYCIWITSEFNKVMLCKQNLIFYFCSNLYGTCLSNLLPVNEFKWLDSNEIQSIDWQSIDENANQGYILEVDLRYPEGLHESHAEFPLAPIKRKITFNDLSPLQQRRLIEDKGERKAKSYKSEKLVVTLEDRNNYVVHIKNLKLYLKLGMKLNKVHRVLTFRQSAFIEPYVSYFTRKRQMARNGFEKTIAKLAINAVYGIYNSNINL